MTEAIRWTNETRRLDELQPWPRNPRQINKDQAKRLAQSFDEFGQVETIAIGPGNEVYNGHQRLSVLMDKHGGAYEVEVRVSSRPLSEKEREKLTVFLHKGAAGEWNFDALANGFEVPELLEWGFDEKELQLGGFELDQPEGEDPGAQIDKAEELRVKWGVESGQLWKLGEHRLICGDCTDRAVVDRVMGGEKAQLMISDPPYNVGYEYEDTVDDNKQREEYADFCSNYFSVGSSVSKMQVITPGKANERLYSPVEWMTWYKGFGLSRGHYFKAMVTEPILLFGEKPTGKFYATDHFDISTDREPGLRELHSCPKPVALFDALIEPMTERGDLVYEAFSGSGTTIIVCERLSRKCRAVEISPAYCAVAIQRWVDMTGGVPELIS